MEVRLLSGVEKFIESLTPGERARAIRTIELLEEFGQTLELPHSRHMKDGLLELRISGKRAIRIFYCFDRNNAVLLHGFIKKTQQTPEREIKTARTQIKLL